MYSIKRRIYTWSRMSSLSVVVLKNVLETSGNHVALLPTSLALLSPRVMPVQNKVSLQKGDDNSDDNFISRELPYNLFILTRTPDVLLRFGIESLWYCSHSCMNWATSCHKLLSNTNIFSQCITFELSLTHYSGHVKCHSDVYSDTSCLYIYNLR